MKRKSTMSVTKKNWERDKHSRNDYVIHSILKWKETEMIVYNKIGSMNGKTIRVKLNFKNNIKIGKSILKSKKGVKWGQ